MEGEKHKMKENRSSEVLQDLQPFLEDDTISDPNAPVRAQDRLKISGAWWKIENAAKMLALRISRVNGDWDAYWGKLYRHAA